jgi:hypothetical protein
MSDYTARTASPEESGREPDGTAPAPRRFEDLPPAAQRALREAEDRRAGLRAEEARRPREVGGRGGKDPARYGDWEVKGVAVDF